MHDGIYKLETGQYIPIFFLPSEAKMIDSMVSWWTGFATSGSPNSNGDAPTWPAYNGSQGASLQIDLTPGPQFLYNKRACDFWAGLNLLTNPSQQ